MRGAVSDDRPYRDLEIFWKSCWKSWKSLLKAAGQRVSLSYEQHVGVPTNCFGETDYFITRVQLLGN